MEIMNGTIRRLVREKEQAARDAMNRMRYTAPKVYRAIQDLQRSKSLQGLGDFDFSDLVDTLVTVKAAREISADERKAADAEYRALQDKNASIERQIQLEIKLQNQKNKGLTLAQQASMAGESVVDQLLEKPWALPLLAALGFGLYRSVSSRRRRG